MRITKKDTLAIVVDYQEKLIPAMDRKEELIKDSAVLIKGIKALGVPVIVSQQYTKGLGETITEIKEALPEDYTLLEKNTFTLYNDENKSLIDNMWRKNIIICGTETHICVLQTALDLIEAGYNVFMPVDCVGSRREMDKNAGIQRFIREGGFVTSKEAILFELTYSSKDEAFRTVSDLIK